MSELEINPENYYLDVLQNPDYYLTGEKPTFKKVIKEAYSREQVLKLLEPHLTIPKSIADELDKRWETQNKYLQRKIAVPRDALYNAVNPYDNQLAATKIGKWIDENQNICFAYLAGKALGVDLVKVVEG